MADETTPETPETQSTPSTGAGDQVAAAEAPDAAAEPAGAPDEAAGADPATEDAAPAAEPTPPAPPLTREERRVAARARRGKRRGATPEERAEARKEKAASRSRYRAKRREKDRAKRAEAGPAAATPPKEHGPGRPKERLGTVVSDKAEKTITVRIDVARRHRRYQKIVRSSTTLHAHDERNEANEGDLVRVIESRPLSATKRWRLVEILERAK
jgi:small subunit ribosomal protein S17